MLLARGSLDVVVAAGLPGAGKTTLVASEPRALDSDAVRLAWAPRLRRVPYGLCGRWCTRGTGSPSGAR